MSKGPTMRDHPVTLRETAARRRARRSPIAFRVIKEQGSKDDLAKAHLYGLCTSEGRATAVAAGGQAETTPP